VKLVEEAIRSGQRLGGMFFSESALPLAEKLLPQINARVEILLLPDSLFNSIVPSDAPQGVAALVKIHAASANHLLERSDAGRSWWLPVFRIRGTWARFCVLRRLSVRWACFFHRRHCQSVQLEGLRGSAGSIFRLPVVADFPAAELIPLLRQQRARLVATSSHKGTALPQATWTLPLAIFIGNESAGLPRELLHQMDETVVIPQAAQVESLNAGVAASIVLYEWARGRIRISP